MHKFIYENEYTEQEPRKITIEVGMDADLTEMLESFESYLRAVGYNFDGVIDIHSVAERKPMNTHAIP